MNPYYGSNMMGMGPATVCCEPGIKVELDNLELWKQFHAQGNEMIVTKPGRRMFPNLQFRIEGLDPKASYALLLELVSADDERRHRFVDGEWLASGNAEPITNQQRQIYIHPDSPVDGSVWMNQLVNFNKLKLSNSNSHSNPSDYIVLNSMQKYGTRIYILRLNPVPGISIFSSMVQKVIVSMMSFPETEFYAVTAYQNEKIIQLKINNNPFAKGFRSQGKHDKCKRTTGAEVTSIGTKSAKRRRQTQQSSVKYQQETETIKYSSAPTLTTPIFSPGSSAGSLCAPPSLTPQSMTPDHSSPTPPARIMPYNWPMPSTPMTTLSAQYYGGLMIPRPMYPMYQMPSVLSPLTPLIPSPFSLPSVSMGNPFLDRRLYGQQTEQVGTGFHSLSPSSYPGYMQYPHAFQ